ncbi:MAG TPA: tetratricopeptide repeat protein [Bryobacteraceae bacterium]|nr:tetratricopeptide repeat protein [Bryobacteraceae bacterium]
MLLGGAGLLCAEDAVSRGFNHFYNLEFDQAVQAFVSAIQKDPSNPDVHNHLAQAILYREMLRAGSLESELVTGSNPFLRRDKLKPAEEDRVRFDSAIETSLKLTQAALNASPGSVPALYAQGVAYGLRGNYNFLVRKAWNDALQDVTTSRKLHAKVTRLQPEHYDARLVQGFHDYVVGSLPFAYKILGFVVGFRGDKEGGIRTLQLVAANGNANRNDAKMLLAVVYRRERRPGDAIPLLNDLLQAYPRNYLLRLEMVQMYGDLGDKQKALAALLELERMRRVGTPGFSALPAEKINFARGNLLFWYRDYDRAIEELKKAAAKARELDLNTGATTFLRLGQCYDMQRQRSQAMESYRAAIALAPDSDAARQSKQYLTWPYKRGKV